MRRKTEDGKTESDKAEGQAVNVQPTAQPTVQPKEARFARERQFVRRYLLSARLIGTARHYEQRLLDSLEAVHDEAERLLSSGKAEFVRVEEVLYPKHMSRRPEAGGGAGQGEQRAGDGGA
jgi:predicted component of viral defense system (DUF524 family)